MQIKNLKQIIFFKAMPEQIYEALLDEKEHAKFTGTKARIDRKIGGKFSTYDGYSWGKNLKLEQNKKIIQQWTCNDFPKDHFTEIKIELKKHLNGTRLIFTQKKIPAGSFKDITNGWKEFYWKPLKDYIAINS